MLTGGDTIQMWQSSSHEAIKEEEEDDPDPGGGGGGVEFFIEDTEEHHLEWQCIWHCRPANPITQLSFSPDGLLFASLSKVHATVTLW